MKYLIILILLSPLLTCAQIQGVNSSCTCKKVTDTEFDIEFTFEQENSLQTFVHSEGTFSPILLGVYADEDLSQELVYRHNNVELIENYSSLFSDEENSPVIIHSFKEKFQIITRISLSPSNPRKSLFLLFQQYFKREENNFLSVLPPNDRNFEIILKNDHTNTIYVGEKYVLCKT